MQLSQLLDFRVGLYSLLMLNIQSVTTRNCARQLGLHVVLLKSRFIKSKKEYTFLKKLCVCILEFTLDGSRASAGKKLQSICSSKHLLADGTIAILVTRFISFFDFYFQNRITFSTHDEGLYPYLAFSPQHLPFCATCTPSVAKSLPIPLQHTHTHLRRPQPLQIRPPPPFHSFRPHSRKSRYQEMEIVLAGTFGALKCNQPVKTVADIHG